MLISYDWLNDFIKLPKTATPEEVASKFTKHTVEVEGLKKQDSQWPGVIVAKVLAVEPHPNADRLRVTQVDIKSEVLTIVCGAPNVAAGQLVAVATLGAVLPNGLEIKESSLRGVVSRGMICAEDELGLGDNHEGIMVLNKNAKIGEPLAKYLKLTDVVLEIDNKSLSNRSDLWGHYGLARELGVIYEAPLKDYSELLEPEIIEGEESLNVKVEDTRLCQRYLALAFGGVEVAESPQWLKDRLQAVGVRPINNIVDLTNYVMLETGQPLHAFDRALVDKITIRLAKKKEQLVLLDGQEKELDEEMLVITDGEQPIAVAGVMGGKDSGVSLTTNEIILEAANFEAVSIRKTAAKLGVRTEASMRFEKSLDPNLAEIALRRFYSLLKQIVPGVKVISKISDQRKFNLSVEPVSLSLDWINERAGQEIPATKVVSILERLGFSLTNDNGVLSVLIPSWRAAKDVRLKEDILEEILRFWGYDNLPSLAPMASLIPPIRLADLDLERKLEDFLSGSLNLTEVQNYSFVSHHHLKKLGLGESAYLKLANPLSDQYDYLRQNLAVNLLNNVRTNQFNFSRLAFFEIGRVYFDTPGIFDKAGDDNDRLPYQQKRLGLLLASKEDLDNFSVVKGWVESLFENLFGKNWEPEFVVPEDLSSYGDPSQTVRVRLNDRDLGMITVISASAAKEFGLKMKAVVAELSLVEIEALLAVCPVHKYQAPSKYPAVERDLAFVVSGGMLYNDLRKEIKKFNPLITAVELFDTYQGGQLGEDKKSLAFHLSYQAEDRTLRSEEVEEIQKELVKYLEEKFSAQIRNF
ncbi:MAG: phenylalanine--tRNA ligase subunit beta [Patescibacteria group bacterium]|nr:phenylalanine--tRNA ligase subunit beta [Patescibacteria group bacterium]MDD3435181.1 phenylalanine--tRNA ligase subunit beta [Patescibacteria group bacterium]MDD4466639.1 phenylalanine--tRNA ligase subunit beta [Patescibacteria group bacterium]